MDQEPTSLKERIEELMQKMGWGIVDVANVAGVSHSAVSQWLGKGSKPIHTIRNIDAIDALALKTGYRPTWIGNGKGPKFIPGHPSTDGTATLGVFKNAYASGNVATLEGFRTKNQTDTFVIPQFETGGAMGNGVLLRDQPGVIQRWIVNSEWIHKNIKSHTGAANLCIVTGFGDSMKGMFNSGDPLVVDKGVKTVEFDAIYFFRVADEGFIKRLQRIPGEGIRVLSENKKYDSWTIKPGMEFEVFGRVVKAWQGEDF